MEEDRVINKRDARRRLQNLVPVESDKLPAAHNISCRILPDLAFGLKRLREGEGMANSRVIQQALRVYFEQMDAAREDDQVLEQSKTITAETALRVRRLEDGTADQQVVTNKIKAMEKLVALVQQNPILEKFVPGFSAGSSKEDRMQFLMSTMGLTNIAKPEAIAKYLSGELKAVNITITDDGGNPLDNESAQILLKKLKEAYEGFEEVRVGQLFIDPKEQQNFTPAKGHHQVRLSKAAREKLKIKPDSKLTIEKKD